MHSFTPTHPLYPSFDQSVRGIAEITSAFISSQAAPVSAGFVYDFVKGLQKALSEPPAADVTPDVTEELEESDPEELEESEEEPEAGSDETDETDETDEDEE